MSGYSVSTSPLLTIVTDIPWSKLRTAIAMEKMEIVLKIREIKSESVPVKIWL